MLRNIIKPCHIIGLFYDWIGHLILVWFKYFGYKSVRDFDRLCLDGVTFYQDTPEMFLQSVSLLKVPKY